MKKALVFILIFMMVVPFQAFAFEPLELPEKTNKDFNGMFTIESKMGDSWVNLGSLAYGKFQETKELDLGEHQSNKNTLIKITQKGGGAAYLDSVFLDGATAFKANGTKSKVLNKLSKEDLDVTPVKDGIILEFETSNGRGILSVTGRIENEVISTQPIQFPAENNFKFKEEIKDFYTYTLGSNIGTVKVDGVLDEVQNLEPFIKDYRIPDSGHPAGDTYFWVMNDDENLYVTMDVTTDNTFDGDKDYAKVYVNTDEGIKEFKVSVLEKNWGNTEFTYTDKVDYEHKVYEFKIPLNEITTKNCNDIKLSFVIYGTASYNNNCDNPALAYDSTNNVYLCVFEHLSINEDLPYNRIVGEFVGKDGEPIGYRFLIDNFYDEDGIDLSNPSVVFNPERDEFFVTWVQNGIENSDTDYVRAAGIKYNEAYQYRDITIEPFNVATLSFDDSDYGIKTPKIAFDSDNNEYLLVWLESDDTYKICGQFLDADGSLKGSKFDIKTSGVNRYPSIFYSKSQKAFLVAWESEDNGEYIEACGVKWSEEENKAHVSNIITVGEGMDPNVAYNYNNDLFFVTWENDDIYGQYFDLNNNPGANYLEPVPKMDQLKIREPHDGYYLDHPASYFDGFGNMLTVWDLFKAEGDCYAELCYIDGNAKPKGSPFYTDDDSGDNINVSRMPIAISGDYGYDGENSYQNIIAYITKYENEVAYRIIGREFSYFVLSNPDISYGNNYYLSVFNCFENDVANYYICGEILNSAGEVVSNKFIIYNSSIYNETPTVAYDAKNDCFLVVWSESYGDGGTYLKARTVKINESDIHNPILGDPFYVSGNKEEDDYYSETYPDLTYGKDGQFLLVWMQEKLYLEQERPVIYGRLINSEDTMTTNNFALSESKNQYFPKASYDPLTDVYIVTWGYYSLGANEAQIVKSSGEVPENGFIEFGENAMNPYVSLNNFNDDKNQFLLTWLEEDYGEEGLIYLSKGQYIEINDELIPKKVDDPFIIATSDEISYPDSPATYRDGKGNMLCAWVSFTEDNDVPYYARLQYIDYIGRPIGNAFYTDDNEHNRDQLSESTIIEIAGDNEGSILIAYEHKHVPEEGTYDPQELGLQKLAKYTNSIGYRIFRAEVIEPKEPELKFEKGLYSVTVGETVPTKLNYFDGIEYVDINYDKVTYFSGDTSIATISTGGAIKGIKVGTTTVSAIYATSINGVPTTLSAITNVEVYKKTESQPSGGGGPVKPVIIGQIIVDGEVVKDIYAEDLVSNRGIYSFEATKTGENAKLWLLGSYYNQISSKNQEGTLQLVWDAASYNLPLNSEEVLKEINKISNSKVNIILTKVTDKDLIDSAMLAVDKLGGKVVSGLVDFEVSIEGKTKAVNIDSYDMYVERTIEELNKVDAYSTTAMKLIEDNEFTFAPSVFHAGTARIKYRGNGIFAIVNNPKTFNDITNHWSRTNVEKLAARNIAFGKNEGVFAPNDYVTRAEFAVMITRALGITEEEGTMNFDDVSGWYAEDIARAYAAGLINGRGDGKFYPNERILRKDMAVMINNAIKFVGKEVTPKNTDEILSMFVDSSTIDEYAKECTAICVDAGIIMGRDTKEFDPNENATRAEASAIIERMLRYLDFIN